MGRAETEAEKMVGVSDMSPVARRMSLLDYMRDMANSLLTRRDMVDWAMETCKSYFRSRATVDQWEEYTPDYALWILDDNSILGYSYHSNGFMAFLHYVENPSGFSATHKTPVYVVGSGEPHPVSVWKLSDHTESEDRVKAWVIGEMPNGELVMKDRKGGTVYFILRTADNDERVEGGSQW